MIYPDYKNNIVNIAGSIEKYFDLKQEGNKITILNKRTCLTKKLSLLFSCVASNGQTYKRELLLSLGGN